MTILQAFHLVKANLRNSCKRELNFSDTKGFFLNKLYLVYVYFAGFGCKKNPFHVLILHGEIPLTKSLTLEHFTHKEFIDWFNSENGESEGIIWHSSNGQDMFKV